MTITYSAQAYEALHPLPATVFFQGAYVNESFARKYGAVRIVAHHRVTPPPANPRVVTDWLEPTYEYWATSPDIPGFRVDAQSWGHLQMLVHRSRALQDLGYYFRPAEPLAHL